MEETFEKNEEYSEIDVKELFKYYFKKIWIIVLVALLSAVITFTCVFNFVSPKYKSTGKLYVNAGISAGSITIGGIEAGRSLVDTYVEILKTNDTLDLVKNKAKSEDPSVKDLTNEDLLSMISAGSANGTEILYISITDTVPDRATLLVNTMIEVLMERIENIIKDTNTSYVDQASKPQKVSPHLVRDTAIALVGGAVVALIVLFFTFILDKKIHDEDCLLENYKSIPLLTVVPDLNAYSGKGGKYGKYGKYKYGYGGHYGYYSNVNKSNNGSSENNGGKNNV